eukprot:5761478-Prymnesium_polylepis.2
MQRAGRTRRARKPEGRGWFGGRARTRTKGPVGPARERRDVGAVRLTDHEGERQVVHHCGSTSRVGTPRLQRDARCPHELFGQLQLDITVSRQQTVV